MNFTPTRRFRRDYDRLFRRDPQAANLMLLLCELADKNGRVNMGPHPEAELAELMGVRFQDRFAYQLPTKGGPVNG